MIAYFPLGEKALINNGHALLVALKNGLAPLAEPLDCEDMRGPRSQFGEEVVLPRPVCAFGDAADPCVRLDALIPRSRAVVLFDSRLEPNPSPELSVPAHTYLIGRCTSAFDVAWDLHGLALLPVWGAVSASTQSGGRGQMRKPWHSPRGNLHVCFPLPEDLLRLAGLASAAVGYLCVLAFRAAGYTLSLKWPNDLLDVSGRKVGGILLEEKNGVLMAGLGVNLQEAPDAETLRRHSAPPAGVLFAGEGGEEYAPPAPFGLWRALVYALIEAYENHVRGKSPAAIARAAEAHLAWKDRLVHLEDGGRGLSGFCRGVSPAGGLLLQVDGLEQEHFSGSLFAGD